MALSDAQVLPAAIAGAAVAVAIVAGWRDHRRRARHDPDAVGWVDWTQMHVLALIVAAIATWIAATA
ncbi:hypothetical protein [uncultured Sphingomonas sp.]|uniref:hypothetical protein n=1 Tax=uncultured Sphingomonas sp. TaxID=158754 RepID=UPI0025EBEFA5|nr:hypothetical protein [uncultured Sphingomonas sp.]